eukprot:7149364-Lingulodinium_polyedra.AAC.1
MGAPAVKLTGLLADRALAGLLADCPHDKREWRVPWSGRGRIHAPHPPLRGRQRAIWAPLWE